MNWSYYFDWAMNYGKMKEIYARLQSHRHKMGRQDMHYIFMYEIRWGVVVTRTLDNRNATCTAAPLIERSTLLHILLPGLPTWLPATHAIMLHSHPSRIIYHNLILNKSHSVKLRNGFAYYNRKQELNESERIISDKMHKTLAQ